MLLAAGEGKRLGTPKALVELGAQRPALERQGARQMGGLGRQRRPPGIGALTARVEICV